MENNEGDKVKNEKQNKTSGKAILLSAAAGLAAMLLFLAAYYFISSQRKAVFYEGEGKYTAFAADSAGVSSEYSGMEIELKSNGKCYVNLNEKSGNGKWKRVGDRIEITVGRRKMTGTLTGDRLEITSDGTGAVRIGLLKDADTAQTEDIPAGYWKLVSVTDGFSLYSEELLKKLGYDGAYFAIDETGKGTAKLLDNAENGIAVKGNHISYNGMLLAYSFSENQLSVSYADGVTLTFEK